MAKTPADTTWPGPQSGPRSTPSWSTTGATGGPRSCAALDKGNLVVARDQGDQGALLAFCAFEVNRRGRLGPVAVRLDLMGQGHGQGVLLGALHELRRRGAGQVSVSWVGPIPPYAAVGGRVGAVYFVYRKELS